MWWVYGGVLGNEWQSLQGSWEGFSKKLMHSWTLKGEPEFLGIWGNIFQVEGVAGCWVRKYETALFPCLSSALVNSAAVNIRVHVSFSRKVLFGYMPKNGISGSCGSSIFSFLRYLHTVFHRGSNFKSFYSPVHSTSHCYTSIPFSSILLPLHLLSRYLTCTILRG